MKKVFAVIALVLLSASACFALSDSEYLRMRRNNADFARADRRLNHVWNRLKDSMSVRAFARLQELQDDWIAYGRDREARAYINDGYSRVEAYTMATSDRAEKLPRIAESVNRNLRRTRRTR